MNNWMLKFPNYVFGRDTPSVRFRTFFMPNALSGFEFLILCFGFFEKGKRKNP